jgi:trehalose/maltose hydrolase-like predicted phosphorylase
MMADGGHKLIGPTAEAVAFTWEGAAWPSRRGGVAPVRRRVEALSAVGVDVVVLSQADVAHVDEQLRSRPPGPGRLLLCGGRGTDLFEAGPEGLRPLRVRADGRSGGLLPRAAGRTCGPDAIQGVLGLLAGRGVGPGLILLIGTEFGVLDGVAGSDSWLLGTETARVIAVSVGAEPGQVPAAVVQVGGGRPAFLALLDEQLRRRSRGRVAWVDEDPAWVLRETGIDPLRHRVTESLFTLGAGGLATRGSVEEARPGGVPAVLAAGVYDGTGPGQHLLPGPGWTAVPIEPAPAQDVRVLDLRTGVLARTEQGLDAYPLRSLRFASITLPGVVAMRAEALADRLRPGVPFQRPPGKAMPGGHQDGVHWAAVAADHGGGISALAVQRTRRDGRLRTVERVASYVTGQRRRPRPGAAADALRAAGDLGFDRLLAEHRAAWAARWAAVDVRIPDDPAAQLAIRFALFQLWCNTKSRDELAVGARGVSGTGYAGHVFWDADVFVLPAVLSMDPAAAAAMIRYRLRRLRAAQARARAAGRRGACFPWESAADGEDITPASGHLGGRVIPILTGQLEEHVTADVAWAAARYAEWTGRSDRLARPLLLETARYWASRCRLDDAGDAHIDAVIGPDEYHERVDDNAYTNVMARWNLRAAADAADRAGLTDAESRSWRDLAARIVDGYDPATGRYEQFAGYFGLEPLLVADFAAPPVAADLLLGRERVAASQVIKQPDVLMLHHLVPEEVEAGSLAPNLDYYGPRTAHGSSLSPAVTASLLARARRPDEALAMLRTALALDTADLSGTTAAGLHLANLGGVWQAMLIGFAGLRVRAGVLTVDPQLPGAWGSLQLRFRCLGRRVRLDITREHVEIATDGPLRAGLAGATPGLVSGGARLDRRG